VVGAKGFCGHAPLQIRAACNAEPPKEVKVAVRKWISELNRLIGGDSDNGAKYQKNHHQIGSDESKGMEFH
jgi:hypothetical protein